MSFETAFASRTDLQQYAGNAILLFALEMKFLIDDIHTVAADALTDGNDDKKCDLIYVNRDDGIAVVAQGYFATDTTRASAPANKASDLNTAAGWLLNRDVNELPERIQSAAKQLREAIREGEIRSLQFWYVHNLPQSANVEGELTTVRQTAMASLTRHLGHKITEVVALEVGRDLLGDWYKSLTNPILVQETFEVAVPGGYELSCADWSACVTAVPAKWLRSIYDKHKANLFSANIRGYLGSRASDLNINHGIKSTISNHPEHFWPFNNGLTILVHSFSLDDTRTKLTFTGISIVNGAQTTGAIGSIAGNPSDSAMVHARFISCNSPSTIKDIIKYNNSQNKVEPSDFRSNDAIQSRLRAEFESSRIATYTGGRRGGDDDRIRRPGNVIPSDTVGQALAAFHGDPVIAYNDKSNIWTADHLYSRYFSSRTSADHILFTISLLRVIEGHKRALMTRSSLSALPTHEGEQLAFLRHRGSIILLLSAIAGCVEVVLGKTVPDRFALSFGRRYPSVAESYWLPILNATIPFASHLLPAVKNGLNNTEIALSRMKEFRNLVSATSAANATVYKEFAGRIVGA